MKPKRKSTPKRKRKEKSSVQFQFAISFVVIMIVMILSAKAFGQDMVYWQDCQTPQSYNYTSTSHNIAPCSIDYPSQLVYDLWVIRVGKYRNFKTSYETVFAINISNVFYYYYHVLYSCRDRARETLQRFQYEGYFCDAYIVRFPFADFIGFKY